MILGFVGLLIDDITSTIEGMSAYLADHVDWRLSTLNLIDLRHRRTIYTMMVKMIFPK